MPAQRGPRITLTQEDDRELDSKITTPVFPGGEGYPLAGLSQYLCWLDDRSATRQTWSVQYGSNLTSLLYVMDQRASRLDQPVSPVVPHIEYRKTRVPDPKFEDAFTGRPFVGSRKGSETEKAARKNYDAFLLGM